MTLKIYTFYALFFHIILLVYCVGERLFTVNKITKLKMVHILYRHGDRTPGSFYPNDPYKDTSEWPVGVGELTNKGKRMAYELGKWIKRNYEDFLSEDYRED